MDTLVSTDHHRSFPDVEDMEEADMAGIMETGMEDMADHHLLPQEADTATADMDHLLLQVIAAMDHHHHHHQGGTVMEDHHQDHPVHRHHQDITMDIQ